jgi:hypothetical protein
VLAYIPSTKVASSNVHLVAASAFDGGVGSHTSTEWSAPSAGALVSPPSHDKSVDFTHHKVHRQQSTLDDYITTQEFRGLTELTALRSQSEHLVYWQYQLYHLRLSLQP